MCGRKTLSKGKMEIIEELSIQMWDESYSHQPSYNIAPTNILPIMIYENGRIIRPMQWGLIPTWAKDMEKLPIFINARAESLLEKPSFSNLLHANRCVVITDGYYEWKQENGHKQPYYIHYPDYSILPMAGLWNVWTSPTGVKKYTYTVITTEANSQLSFIHQRMPAILAKQLIEEWIRCGQFSSRDAISLLKPFERKLEAYPVSTAVNSVRNNFPGCIERLK